MGDIALFQLIDVHRGRQHIRRIMRNIKFKIPFKVQRILYLQPFRLRMVTVFLRHDVIHIFLICAALKSSHVCTPAHVTVVFQLAHTKIGKMI